MKISPNHVLHVQSQLCAVDAMIQALVNELDTERKVDQCKEARVRCDKVVERMALALPSLRTAEDLSRFMRDVMKDQVKILSGYVKKKEAERGVIHEVE